MLTHLLTIARNPTRHMKRKKSSHGLILEDRNKRIKTHQQDPRKKTKLILNVTSTSSPHSHTHTHTQTSTNTKQRKTEHQNKGKQENGPRRTHARKSRNHRLPQTRKTGDENPLQKKKKITKIIKQHCKKQDASYKRTRCEDVRRRGAKKNYCNREQGREEDTATNAAVTGEEKGWAKYKENETRERRKRFTLQSIPISV